MFIYIKIKIEVRYPSDCGGIPLVLEVSILILIYINAEGGLFFSCFFEAWADTRPAPTSLSNFLLSICLNLLILSHLLQILVLVLFLSLFFLLFHFLYILKIFLVLLMFFLCFLNLTY